MDVCVVSKQGGNGRCHMLLEYFFSLKIFPEKQKIIKQRAQTSFTFFGGKCTV